MRTPATLPTRPARRAAAALATLCALAACDAASATAPDEGPGDSGNAGDPGTPGSGGVPSALVGGWRSGSVSPTNFWNDHTGVYSGNAYGMSDHYEFARNGTYKEYVYLYTQSYGCRTQVWVEMEGTVRFDATSFTTTVARGRFKASDTCAASRYYDRAMTAAEARERSKRSEYAVRSDEAGKTYLEILDGRYQRVQ